MGIPRGEMLARMSSRELSEWIAFDRIEPLPDPWHQTGLLAALMCNLWGSGPKRRPEDFIPAHATAREQSPAEILARFQLAGAGASAAAAEE